jgi:hypothetical protein
MTDAAVERLSAEIAQGAALFAQKRDGLRESLFFVRLSEADYRAASFLDDRILTVQRQSGWMPEVPVRAALARGADARPLHFIFHTGHVGSTLLSRLLDELDGVLPLREPLTLRTLAETHDRARELDALVGEAGLATQFETNLQLWSRGFASTRAVVLKATSSTGRIAPALLAAAPQARAVYLNAAPETYLATLLAGENSPIDLRGMGGERILRLARIAGPPDRALHALSLGELAAMTWLAERLAQQAALAAAPGRVLALDIDAFLAAPGETVANVAAHFGLACGRAKAAAIAQSPALTRYAKAPEHAYSPALRAEILADARRHFADEIRKGLVWLDAYARAHPIAAAAL